MAFTLERLLAVVRPLRNYHISYMGVYGRTMLIILLMVVLAASFNLFILVDYYTFHAVDMYSKPDDPIPEPPDYLKSWKTVYYFINVSVIE